MKYFKDENTDEVYAYDQEQIDGGWVKEGLVQMTDEEVSAHVAPPPPPAPTREQIEAQRLRAYADPLTGSDRHFAEAARLQVMGGTAEAIDAAKAAGTARYEAIQAEYPWP